MRYSELANRYAVAIYSLAQESKSTEVVLTTLKAIATVVNSDEKLVTFVNSPLVSATEKEKLFKAALSEKGISEVIVNFIALLSRRNRLQILPEVVAAYQAYDDNENKVARGTVRSTAGLSDKQKNEITKTVELITKKKVVLSYEEDKSFIGGLVAQVGSLTFDDTLTGHIRRIKEDLNRRIN